MAFPATEKLATYGIEVLVVVFGILIAFQVEEWREDRQRNRDLDAALIRLAEETASNLAVCERVVPRFAANAQWVLTVVQALNQGKLDEADIENFDTGLIRVGYIQGAPYSVTVAEEMIATGLLKDLDDDELRHRVAELPVWIEDARGWLDDTRGSLRMAVAEVVKVVEFGYHGQIPAFDNNEFEDIDFEEGISVKYEIDALVANPTLKNVLIEAADTHVDMWVHHRVLCTRFDEIQSSLAKIDRN
jgi:hypothetical protein